MSEKKEIEVTARIVAIFTDEGETKYVVKTESGQFHVVSKNKFTEINGIKQ